MAIALDTGPRGFSSKVRLAMFCAAALVLAVPLVAMQFTNEVNWSLGDFMVFGGMLLILCISVEVAARYPARRALRLTAMAISLAIFVLVWAELAVGLLD